VKRKVAIFSRVPVKTRDVSWRHDRRQDRRVMRREDEEAWDGSKK